MDEAYPGDIVGIVGNNDFLIGDTLSEEPGIVFSEMPRFAPESFAYLHNDTPAHFKRFRDGLTQLLKEGVVQSFDQPDALVKIPLLGAVGPLQFDVLQYRLESEYGAKSRMEAAPWSQILWVREKGADSVNGDFQANPRRRFHREQHGRRTFSANGWSCFRAHGLPSTLPKTTPHSK